MKTPETAPPKRTDNEKILPLEGYQVFVREILAGLDEETSTDQIEVSLSHIFTQGLAQGLSRKGIAKLVYRSLYGHDSRGILTKHLEIETGITQVEDLPSLKRDKVLGFALRTIHTVMADHGKYLRPGFITETYFNGSREPDPAESKLIHRVFYEVIPFQKPLDLNLRITALGTIEISENGRNGWREVDNERELFLHVARRFSPNTKSEDFDFTGEINDEVFHHNARAELFHFFQDGSSLGQWVNETDHFEVSPEGWVYELKEGERGKGEYERIYSRKALNKYWMRSNREKDLLKTQARKFEVLMEKISERLPSVLKIAAVAGLAYVAIDNFDALMDVFNSEITESASQFGRALKESGLKGEVIEAIQPIIGEEGAQVATSEGGGTLPEVLQGVEQFVGNEGLSVLEQINQGFASVPVGETDWKMLSQVAEQIITDTGREIWAIEVDGRDVTQVDIMVDTIIKELSKTGSLGGTSQMTGPSFNYTELMSDELKSFIESIVETGSYDDYRKLIGK